MHSYFKYNITKSNISQSLFVRFCVLFVCVMSFVVTVIPTPYILEMPGPTLNILGKNGDCSYISSKDSEINYNPNEDGEILLLSVSVTGGSVSYNNIISTINGIVSDDIDIIPNEAIYPPNSTTEEVKEQTEQDMKNSQNSAINAANHILIERGSNSIDDEPSLCNENIGGPSAGLAFTLGILQRFSTFNITKGRIIAATGTIDDNGNVGKIGGLKQKIKTAYRDGARVVFAPKGNVQELDVSKIPADLEIIPVENINDVLNYI